MRSIIISVVALALIACNLTNPATVTVNSTTTPVPSPTTTQTIAYWQSLPITDVTPTADDYVFIEQIVLRRVDSGASSGDVESMLTDAIGFMLMSDNIWQAEDVVLNTVSVEGDLATVNLTGEIRAVGGAILSLVPTQFLLTIFEQPTINRVILTLNGEALANISASHDSQIKPADFVYTRETFFTELNQD